MLLKVNLDEFNGSVLTLIVVPLFSESLLDEETERIKKTSGCDYLEDLLTCVHITHVKILTSVRVSQQQKKIDIEVPKLNNFIHKIYIELARRI